MVDSWSLSARSHPNRRPFWGGLAIGVVSGIIVTLLTVVFLAPHSSPTKAATTVNTGNFTITMSDALLTIGMRMALKKVQGQLPVTLSNPVAATQTNNRLNMNVDAIGPAGLSIGVHFVFSPKVSTSGQLTFTVIDAQLGGLSIPGVNGVIENALNQQFADFGKGQLNGLQYQLTEAHTVSGSLIITAKVSG